MFIFVDLGLCMAVGDYCEDSMLEYDTVLRFYHDPWAGGWMAHSYVMSIREFVDSASVLIPSDMSAPEAMTMASKSIIAASGGPGEINYSSAIE